MTLCDTISLVSKTKTTDPDGYETTTETLTTVFQSTLPSRGATANFHKILTENCEVCAKNLSFSHF